MPRISAPTVAEHRARKRSALLTAATELLLTQGVAAVTPAAVGAAAGLARSSVYQYFGSSAELVAAIVEEAFPPWNAAIRGAMSRADTPAGRIEAYFRETLRLTAEGAHRTAGALAGAELPAACRERIVELHREQAAPFVEALRDLGVSDRDLTARLLGGLLEAAMRAVDTGAPPRTVTRRTLALVRGALELA